MCKTNTTLEFVKVQLWGEEIKEVPEDDGVSQPKVRFAEVFEFKFGHRVRQ